MLHLPNVNVLHLATMWILWFVCRKKLQCHPKTTAVELLFSLILIVVFWVELLGSIEMTSDATSTLPDLHVNAVSRAWK